MTSIRKLKIISGAGEPDDVLGLRIDVVEAAGKVYETHQALMRLRKKDGWPPLMEACDNAVTDLVIKYGRYKAALKRRQDT